MVSHGFVMHRDAGKLSRIVLLINSGDLMSFILCFMATGFPFCTFSILSTTSNPLTTGLQRNQILSVKWVGVFYKIASTRHCPCSSDHLLLQWPWSTFPSSVLASLFHLRELKILGGRLVWLFSSLKIHQYFMTVDRTNYNYALVTTCCWEWLATSRLCPLVHGIKFA